GKRGRTQLSASPSYLSGVSRRGGHRSALARAALRRGRPSPVADQSGTTVGVLCAGRLGGSARVGPGTGGLGRTGSGRARLGAGFTSTEADDRCADLDGLALVDQQRVDGAGLRAGQLDERLRGLDLNEDLIDGHSVAGGDLPRDDIGFGQALTDVGKRELE